MGRNKITVVGAGNVGATAAQYCADKELGDVVWEHCGMSRTAKGLREAQKQIKRIRKEFWEDLNVPGTAGGVNQALERAGRVADFIDLAGLMCQDALDRDESCGCHLREEHQTKDGEVIRNDGKFANVSVWEFKGDGKRHKKHREKLEFELLEPMKRSYK